MSSRCRAAWVMCGAVVCSACSDRGWTQVAKPYPGFELREVLEQPDVFAPYAIDPESGAAATRSCPEVEILKERVGAPGSGRDTSYAFSADERALQACAHGAETTAVEILLGQTDEGGKPGYRTYEVTRTALLKGSDLSRARVDRAHGEASVRLELTKAAGARLAAFTASHVH